MLHIQNPYTLREFYAFKGKKMLKFPYRTMLFHTKTFDGWYFNFQRAPRKPSTVRRTSSVSTLASSVTEPTSVLWARMKQAATASLRHALHAIAHVVASGCCCGHDVRCTAKFAREQQRVTSVLFATQPRHCRHTDFVSASQLKIWHYNLVVGTTKTNTKRQKYVFS